MLYTDTIRQPAHLCNTCIPTHSCHASILPLILMDASMLPSWTWSWNERGLITFGCLLKHPKVYTGGVQDLAGIVTQVLALQRQKEKGRGHKLPGDSLCEKWKEVEMQHLGCIRYIYIGQTVYITGVQLHTSPNHLPVYIQKTSSHLVLFANSLTVSLTHMIDKDGWWSLRCPVTRP